MIGSNILANLAALAGIALSSEGASASMRNWKDQMIERDLRSRWERRKTRGNHRPAGSKLARKAANGRLGLATLR